MGDMIYDRAEEKRLFDELFDSVHFVSGDEDVTAEPETKMLDWAMSLATKGLPDTDPDPSPKPGARQLRKYWTKGEGAVKIGWGKSGQFDRCVRHLREHVGTGAEGLCAVYYKSVNKRWPGRNHKSLLDALTVFGSSLAVSDSPAFKALKGAIADSADLRNVVAIPAYLSSLMAALEVDTSGDGFKMTWIDAPPLPTKMVEVKTFGDEPDDPNVDSPVREGAFQIDTSDLPVPIGVEASGPAPTTSGDEKALRTFLVEQVKDVERWCDKLGLSSLQKSAVVSFAESTSESASGTFGVIGSASHGIHYTIPTQSVQNKPQTKGTIVGQPLFNRAEDLLARMERKEFAVENNLDIFSGDLKSMEFMEDFLELKVRRVRTPAGVARFKQPIGSIIVRDVTLPNLKINEPKYDGWDFVTGANGKQYDVGQDEGMWRAFGADDWDDEVATAKNADDLYIKLNEVSAPKGKAKGKGKETETNDRVSTHMLNPGDFVEGGGLRGRVLSVQGNKVTTDAGTIVAGKDGTVSRLKVAKDAPKTKVDPDKRDDYVWDETTYAQWDKYEVLDDDQKNAYYAARQGGATHAAAMKAGKGGAAKPAPKTPAPKEKPVAKEPAPKAPAKGGLTDAQKADVDALGPEGKKAYEAAIKIGSKHSWAITKANLADRYAKKKASLPEGKRVNTMKPGDEGTATVVISSESQRRELAKIVGEDIGKGWTATYKVGTRKGKDYGKTLYAIPADKLEEAKKIRGAGRVGNEMIPNVDLRQKGSGPGKQMAGQEPLF